MTEVSTELEEYAVTLMSAALHGVRAGAKPDRVTWEQVYRLADRHSILPMILPALPDGALASGGMPAELAERWRHSADMTLYQQVSYDIEREAITADLRKAGLSWMPLKGIMVAGYYPQPGMRSMSDQDIVVGYVEPDGAGGWRPRGDGADAGGAGEGRKGWARKADEHVDRIMKAHGYEAASTVGRDSSYFKPPLHFEIHRSLISAAEVAAGSAKTAEVDYYANPWRLATCKGVPPCEFRFGVRDEYVFHIDHMSKHYRGSGFGLRFLADEYLYCVRFPEEVGSEYVAEQLGYLGLGGFERAVRELSVALMEHPGSWRSLVGPEVRELFGDVLSGGIYGSMERKIARTMGREQGLLATEPEGAGSRSATPHGRVPRFVDYLWRRLFPPRAIVETYYPTWSNPLARLLLPLHRAALALREHPKRLAQEIVLAWRQGRNGRGR
ncbi:nucleotidyltransferase family protein [Bifidobacterium sp. UTBIF-78]|uniref:nucleotidyltransferase family protein n=1 Tax=Bifidobacterium sp. UTBIF-78 TaxID=1465263 RepID=UPI0015E27926|nr:nucleotidyltransferase family protein [Bifidobacterium sp. UTBIF-78]